MLKLALLTLVLQINQALVYKIVLRNVSEIKSFLRYLPRQQLAMLSDSRIKIKIEEPMDDMIPVIRPATNIGTTMDKVVALENADFIPVIRPATNVQIWKTMRQVYKI